LNGHACRVTERDEANALWVGASDLVLYPDAPIPLFAQLARAIRFRIANWGLPAGSLLPSEPAFAEQHNLSRETVARAYRLLRDAGTITSRRGVGWFVSEEIPVASVPVEPGTTISARPIRPGDVDTIRNRVVMLMTGSLIVEEPGRPPVAYDPMRTIIVVPSQSRAAKGSRTRTARK
jgi:DNA-binding transcriptional MocR family regulator